MSQRQSASRGKKLGSLGRAGPRYLCQWKKLLVLFCSAPVEELNRNLKLMRNSGAADSSSSAFCFCSLCQNRAEVEARHVKVLESFLGLVFVRRVVIFEFSLLYGPPTLQSRKTSLSVVLAHNAPWVRWRCLAWLQIRRCLIWRQIHRQRWAVAHWLSMLLQVQRDDARLHVWGPITGPPALVELGHPMGISER